MKLASVRTKMKLLAAAAVSLGAIAAQRVAGHPRRRRLWHRHARRPRRYGVQGDEPQRLGHGLARACIDGTGPRVCVFEVSGTIRLTSRPHDPQQQHHDRRSDRAVAGHHDSRRRAAASRRPTCSSSTCAFASATMRTARIRPIAMRSRSKARTRGRCATSSSTTARSAGRSTRSLSVWGTYDNITFSNNIFAEPLNESIHPTDDGSGLEKHGYGVILGSNT